MSPEVTSPIILTVKVLTVSSILFLVAGLGFGYYLGRGKSIFRELLDLLVTLPMVFPPVATGFVLLMLLGRVGPLSKIFGKEIVFSFSGVVLASFIAGLPLVVKPIQAALGGDLKKFEEVAMVLGKNRFQAFFLVLLPNIRKSLAAGMVMALGRSLGEVGITLMIGGNIIGRTNTMSLEIYNSVFSGEFDKAAMLSIIIGIMSLIIFISLKKLSAT
jgi:molybdate transport system permease protein